MVELIGIIAGAVLGAGGIVGVFFYFLRRSIEKRLVLAESEAEKRKELSHERAIIEDKLCHAYSRLFFWMYKAIIDGKSNGELKKAFENLETVENQKKDLDRNIIAVSERDT